MGIGFRCGFLGLLHMEIIQERLEREYDLDLITTAPAVAYRVTNTEEEEMMIDNPSQLPDVQKRISIAEPYVKLEVLCPKDFVGQVMELLSYIYTSMLQLGEPQGEQVRTRRRPGPLPPLIGFSVVSRLVMIIRETRRERLAERDSQRESLAASLGNLKLNT